MIYRMFIYEHRSIAWITRELNRRRVPFLKGKPYWSHCSVMQILSHPKYAGMNVFNRTTTRLGALQERTSKSEWVMTPNAFEAIVDPETFNHAQQIFAHLTARKSDEDILNNLRSLLASEGRLTTRIIDQAIDTPSANTLCRRFGGILEVYRRLSYDVRKEVRVVNVRRRIRALRADLLSKICEIFPDQLRIVSPSHRHRARLMMKERFMVSLLIARYIWQEKKWIATPKAKERRLITLVARLNVHNKEFLDFYILRRVTGLQNILIRAGSRFFEQAMRLEDLSQFYDVVKQIRAKVS
jgi:hypothetical protein